MARIKIKHIIIGSFIGFIPIVGLIFLIGYLPGVQFGGEPVKIGEFNGPDKKFYEIYFDSGNAITSSSLHIPQANIGITGTEKYIKIESSQKINDSTTLLVLLKPNNEVDSFFLCIGKTYSEFGYYSNYKEFLNTIRNNF